MLSRKEKLEMLKDGKSEKRRQDFARAKKVGNSVPSSLDSYIHFLNGIQKVFGNFQYSFKKPTTKFNKL